MRSSILLGALPLVVAFALPGAAGGSSDDDDAVRANAVRWASAQEGLRERGATNCHAEINEWERDMGFRVPPCRVWCGALVHQAYLRAGVRLSARLIDPNRSYADAKAGKRRLKTIPRDQVRPGDILFFKFRQGLNASHMAIVKSRPHDGSVMTAEGNVGQHAVVTQRGLRYAVAAARVDVD